LAASPLSPFLQRISDTSLSGREACTEAIPTISRLGRRFYVGYAVEGVSRDALIRLVDYPELPLRIHTRDTIKAGRTALLVRGEFPIGGRMVSVAYKRVQRRNRWKMLSAWLFGNRTLRTWKTGLMLQRLGIPTANPLMVIVPRWHQPWKPSYLASEWLPQAYNITTYAEWLQEIPAYQSRHRLQAAVEKLGETIGRMHSLRVSHRDLKAGNLLLINKPSSVEAYVIDLDGARRHVWLSTTQRLKDLSRLAIATQSHQMLTRSARLRFLLSYLRAFGESPRLWKACWRRLALFAERRSMKKRRLGSPRV
jgi:tRNA A-37 threonylcarbamoyl transferase component Bud32